MIRIKRFGDIKNGDWIYWRGYIEPKTVDISLAIVEDDTLKETYWRFDTKLKFIEKHIEIVIINDITDSSQTDNFIEEECYKCYKLDEEEIKKYKQLIIVEEL